jgi:hypothetical protein
MEEIILLLLVIVFFIGLMGLCIIHQLDKIIRIIRDENAPRR